MALQPKHSLNDQPLVNDQNGKEEPSNTPSVVQEEEAIPIGSEIADVQETSINASSSEIITEDHEKEAHVPSKFKGVPYYRMDIEELYSTLLSADFQSEPILQNTSDVTDHPVTPRRKLVKIKSRSH